MDNIVSYDLISVVVSYATTKVTLDLVTSFEPLLAYRVSTWKQKTIVESRGLVLDSIGADGSWWEYYLLKNGTLYGDAMQIIKTPSSCDYTTLRKNIIHHRMLDGPAGCGEIEVYQLPDLSISFGGNTVVFNRKIRGVISYDIDYDCVGFLVLDEYGDVWSLADSDIELQAYAGGCGIVQLIDDQRLYCILGLARDGRVVSAWHRDGTTVYVAPIGDIPKTVHYSTVHEFDPNYPGILTLADGERMYVRFKMKSADRAIMENMGNYINEYRYRYNYDRTDKVVPINNALNVIRWYDDCNIAYTTNDRTVHAPYKQGQELIDFSIDGTSHKTQQIDTNSCMPYIYTIIDPV